ncbi:MAG: response regulator [Myxococcota bacterium]
MSPSRSRACASLLIDDEPTVRRSIERVLRRASLLVESFGSSERALARLLDPGRPSFDLAIIDCDLPGMGGADTIRAMRTRGTSLPTIGISGHDGGDELLAAGAASFLVKPFSNAALLAACLRVLRADKATPETDPDASVVDEA